MRTTWKIGRVVTAAAALAVGGCILKSPDDGVNWPSRSTSELGKPHADVLVGSPSIQLMDHTGAWCRTRAGRPHVRLGGHDLRGRWIGADHGFERAMDPNWTIEANGNNVEIRRLVHFADLDADGDPDLWLGAT